MPPSIVLEVMKILEAEISLREETRTAKQAQPQLKKEDHLKNARSLANTQGSITSRTEAVIEKIKELPKGESKFQKEIRLLQAAGRAMNDAGDFLLAGNTGSDAMAAETEAIELLLQAKRSKSKGGGGGGSNPGDGQRSGKDTGVAALALLGESSEVNTKYKKRAVQQATGKSGNELPPEFRDGLDRYFQRLEESK